MAAGLSDAPGKQAGESGNQSQVYSEEPKSIAISYQIIHYN